MSAAVIPSYITLLSNLPLVRFIAASPVTLSQKPTSSGSLTPALGEYKPYERLTYSSKSISTGEKSLGIRIILSTSELVRGFPPCAATASCTFVLSSAIAFGPDATAACICSFDTPLSMSIVDKPITLFTVALRSLIFSKLRLASSSCSCSNSRASAFFVLMLAAAVSIKPSAKAIQSNAIIKPPSPSSLWVQQVRLIPCPSLHLLLLLLRLLH